jgi:hypothetical protein
MRHFGCTRKQAVELLDKMAAAEQAWRRKNAWPQP